MKKALCKAIGMLIAINAELRETSFHQPPASLSLVMFCAVISTAWLTFNLIILRKSYKNDPWLNGSRRTIRIILERSFNQKWKGMCSLNKHRVVSLFFIHRGPVWLSPRVIEITTKWLAIILHERRNICRHLKKWFVVGLKIVWFDFFSCGSIYFVFMFCHNLGSFIMSWRFSNFILKTTPFKSQNFLTSCL